MRGKKGGELAAVRLLRKQKESALRIYDFVATTLFGLEDVLVSELKDLGATDIEKLRRAVKFKGDLALMYRCNLQLRTAIKVLRPIASFEAKDENELYNKVRRIVWSRLLTTEQTFAIDGTTSGEVFTHSKFVALKTKDAIVDQFRDRYGVRPSVDVEDPDLRINIHISGTTCDVSLDSSGVSLGKRGYRLVQSVAPLSEVLAAGILMLTGWDQRKPLIDPMCGSGTFPIEAAMLATNTAPGRLRHFAFEKWKDFKPALWAEIKEEADADRIPFSGKIYGRDMDNWSVGIAAENAERAGVADLISFEKADFLEDDPHFKDGVVVMNPPYGERLMEQNEMIPFYKEIGTRLKHFYTGCDAWMISGNLEAIKFVGLKPSKKVKIYNGPMECKLHKFELYRGSKKAVKQ